MTVAELEKKVWDQDGVRIVVRDRLTAPVGKYTRQYAAQATWSIRKFLDNRINPLVKGREVVVLDGKGKIPNGRTLLMTIRRSYNGNGAEKS